MNDDQKNQPQGQLPTTQGATNQYQDPYNTNEDIPPQSGSSVYAQEQTAGSPPIPQSVYNGQNQTSGLQSPLAAAPDPTFPGMNDPDIGGNAQLSIPQPEEPSKPLTLEDLYGPSEPSQLPQSQPEVSSTLTTAPIYNESASTHNTAPSPVLPSPENNQASTQSSPLLSPTPLETPLMNQNTNMNETVPTTNPLVQESQSLGTLLEPKVDNPFPGVSPDMDAYTSANQPIASQDVLTDDIPQPQYSQDRAIAQEVAQTSNAFPIQPDRQEPVSQNPPPEVPVQPLTAVQGEQSNPIPQATTQAFDTSAFEKKKGGGFPKIPKFVFFAIGILALLTGILAIVAFFLQGNRGTSGSLVGTKGELTWWGVANDQSIVQPLIDEYQSKNPNVKITYLKQTPQEYRERLTNAISAGRAPDIFEIHNTWPLMFQSDLSTLPASVMSEADYTNAFYPVAVNSLKTQNGIVAMPLEYDAIGLYINDDLFLSSALNPPRTWDELRNVVNQTTRMDDTDKRYILIAGIPLGQTDNIDYWQDIVGLMMSQNGVDFRNPSGKPLDDAFSFYKSFDKNWDSSLPRSVQAFARGKSYMLFAPIRATDDIILENPSFIYRTVPLPQLPKERPEDRDVAYASFFVQSVWSRSTNQELAWDFLNYMASSESLIKMNEQRRTEGKQERLYPRPAMNTRFRDDPILGSFANISQNATTWYLADKTYDGATGVNSQVSSVTDKALKGDLDKETTFVGELTKILTKYTTGK